MLDIRALEPKIAEAAKLMEMLSQPVRLRLATPKYRDIVQGPSRCPG